MTKATITTEQSQRKVDAIDKRIDAVRAELHRAAGIDVDSFDFSTQAGQSEATGIYGKAWGANPVLHEIERSLYSRRYDASLLRDTLAAKDARAGERRLAKQMAAEWDAKNRCPTCGDFKLAA